MAYQVGRTNLRELDMSLQVERGEAGLFYGVDPDIPGLFVAAVHRETVTVLAQLALTAMKQRRNSVLPGHSIWSHPVTGKAFILPNDAWQTRAQRRETAWRALDVFEDLLAAKDSLDRMPDFG